MVCPVAANYQDLNLSALGIPLRLSTLLNEVLAKDNQLLLKRCITVSGKCEDALYLSELRTFSPVTLNSVQSLQRYLFNFVGLVIATGKEGFVAFFVCLFLHKKSIRVILSPKPVQNVLLSLSACDLFAKSLLTLQAA